VDPVQPGIPADLTSHARHMFFSAVPGADAAEALATLALLLRGQDAVVGIGGSTARSLGHPIEGLRPLPTHEGPGLQVPSTPAALWVWLRGEDRGDLVHRARAVQASVSDAFGLCDVVDCFRYGASLDLTGYEDGTENPEGEDALAAAVVRGAGAGRDGGSFVAIQTWVHDLDAFEAMTPERRDLTIGRRLSDNEEIDDAPATAHVKRTAQEDFDPEAFLLRRSLPWADGTEEGLVFVAFGRSLDAFDAQLRRMVGAEDGIVDALFDFTRPVSGYTFWCPPMTGDRLDLSLLGL